MNSVAFLDKTGLNFFLVKIAIPIYKKTKNSDKMDKHLNTVKVNICEMVDKL